jgi:hypothetical protein
MYIYISHKIHHTPLLASSTAAPNSPGGRAYASGGTSTLLRRCNSLHATLLYVTCSSSSKLCSGSARVMGESNASISLQSNAPSVNAEDKKYSESYLATSGFACCLSSCSSQRLLVIAFAWAGSRTKSSKGSPLQGGRVRG